MSRSMASPIFTAYPTPETLIPKCFTISVTNIPSSRIAQKHRRLLDLTFFLVSHLKQCHLSHKLRFLRASRFTNGISRRKGVVVRAVQNRHRCLVLFDFSNIYHDKNHGNDIGNSSPQSKALGAGYALEHKKDIKRR